MAAMHRALTSVVLQSLRFAVRGPDRRSVVTGVVLALVVWALATYGLRSSTSVAMALVVVLSGGASSVLFELERMRQPVHTLFAHARRWVCLQGIALLATLACLGAVPAAA